MRLLEEKVAPSRAPAAVLEGDKIAEFWKHTDTYHVMLTCKPDVIGRRDDAKRSPRRMKRIVQQTKGATHV